MTWSELFPEGRLIYFEGTLLPKGLRMMPSAFVKEMKEKYSFDPSANNSSWNGRDGWAFFCPANVLDEIYGNGKYPLGS